jgi:hypothetical protein
VNILSFSTACRCSDFRSLQCVKAAVDGDVSASCPEVGEDINHQCSPTTIDTDMVRGRDKVKATPSDVAVAIVRGIEAGQEDIYPLAAADAFKAWQANQKAVEAKFAEIC